MDLHVPMMGVEGFFGRFEPEDGKFCQCLAECIYMWLSEPHNDVAGEDAAGDFRIWLTIVSLIFNEWQRPLSPEEESTTKHDPIIPRHVSRLLCDKECEGRKIFDPYYFEWMKANPS